jgi:glycosyltransferase involved in cell wall biosynthesis
VKVLGYVSRDSLAALMSEAAAFVYPSRYEGFGLAPLEAMACGAPVLASNVASLPEVVGVGGTLVTGETPEVWGRAIERVLLADRSSVRRGALEQAARFQWDDAAAALLDVLRRATRV